MTTLRNAFAAIALLGLLGTQPALAQEAAADAAPVDDGAMTLQGLLQSVKEGRSADQQENRARLERFAREQSRQEELLAQIRSRRAQLEATSAERETSYEENELMIIDETNGQVRILNGAAGGVWLLCDGKRSSDEMAGQLRDLDLGSPSVIEHSRCAFARCC